MRKAKSINQYLQGFPASTQKLLRQMRSTIHKAAPVATETMKYGIPTFYCHQNLVHFAAFKHHIGFYPTPSAITAFKTDLVRYKASKGAVQFPIDRPLPLALIRKIVRYRVAEADPFSRLAAPAQRALADAGITSLKQLSQKAERQIAQLHGMGPGALNTLLAILRTNGLTFKRETTRNK
jgi:uncharacterized protein YdhG (YjbR/CyaY superfamily)